MRRFLVLVVCLLWRCSVDSICVYPPCGDQVQIPQAGARLNVEDQCCSQTKQELADMQRNMSLLWFTISEFREVVARHLHHLHQHQAQMFSTRMTGEPPQPHNHEHGPHQYHSHEQSAPHVNHGNDPFYGLNLENTPRAFNRPPKVRNPEDYDFAVCHMKPNSAIPYARAHGIVYLSQKTNSHTLYIHMMLSGFNTTSRYQQQDNMQNEEPVFFHGIHVHTTADLSNGCQSTGPHFNPFKARHGGPDAAIRHQGDLGNVVSDSEGAINELITDERASLRDKYSIIGKPLVIHEMEDDHGVNLNDPESTSTGNSGTRIACCIIEELRVEIPAYRKHKTREHELENLDQQVVQKVSRLS